MDRIRKALDLARQERAGVVGDRDPIIKSSEPVAARFQHSIVYTHTRVFLPDAATLEANRIVDPNGGTSAAAAFRMLRTQILQRMEENRWSSLAVLSPSAADGKTTTAINLAVSLAADLSHTVLLVDCDLRRPSVASSLGLAPEYGLNDVLSGKASVDQCLYHPEGFERLVVLPARGVLENSSEALSGPRGRDLVAELRARYPERLLVFDLPPILEADDALALMPMIDCGLLVVAEGGTRRESVIRCMELLRKTPIVGTVLNRATAVSTAYG